MLSDDEYDSLVETLADAWDFLHPDHVWAFGSLESLRATGCHFKFSRAAVGGAYGWLEYTTGRQCDIPKPENWKTRKDGVQYVTTVDARASSFHELVPAKRVRRLPLPVLDQDDLDLIG